MSESLSLWNIERSILELMSIADDPESTPEEAQVALAELEQYVIAEVKKVDSIRTLIRRCDRDEAEALALQKFAEEEAQKQRARAAVFANRRERVKRFAMAAMQAIGLKKIEGATGRLRIQTNGGKRALTFPRPDLIPDSFKTYTLRLAHVEWTALQRALEMSGLAAPLGQSLRACLGGVTMSINEAMVRAVIEKPCPNCAGSGRVNQADAGDHPDNEHELICSDCNGTGHQLVPGAELEARGQHLRVE